MKTDSEQLMDKSFKIGYVDSVMERVLSILNDLNTKNLSVSEELDISLAKSALKRGLGVLKEEDSRAVER